MNRARWWALFAVLVLASAFFAVGMAAEAVQAASGHFQKGSSEGSAIGGAVVGLVFAVVFAWLARSVEHHARTNEGLHASISKGLAVKALPDQRRVAHRSRVFEVVVLAALAFIFVGSTVVGVIDWRRSVETQDHGILDVGSVSQVVPVTHTTRYSSYQTYNYDVSLRRPVKGHLATVVHTDQQYEAYFEGDTVQVLVDPSGPGYAEFPGQPASDASGAFVPLVLGLLVAAGGLWGAARARTRRRARADPWGPGGGTSGG